MPDYFLYPALLLAAVWIVAWIATAAGALDFAWRLHRRSAEKVQELRKAAGGAGAPPRSKTVQGRR